MAMLASVVLVMATILILYETLRLTSNHLAELPLPPRARIIVVVLASFAGHTAAVWTYAFAYWVLAVKWRIGGFAGLPVESFQDCLYFSVVTYTSPGFGDHVPVSHARLIAGVEALNGLLLIGWSASFRISPWSATGRCTRVGSQPCGTGGVGASANMFNLRVHGRLRREPQQVSKRATPITRPTPIRPPSQGAARAKPPGWMDWVNSGRMRCISLDLI